MWKDRSIKPLWDAIQRNLESIKKATARQWLFFAFKGSATELQRSGSPPLTLTGLPDYQRLPTIY